MYDKCITGAGGAGCLASTGVGNVWLVLGAFALLAVGTALMRIVPRRAR